MAMEKIRPANIGDTAFCPGCGHGILNRLIAEVIEEKGYEKKTILTLGVGCSCNMNGSWNGDKIQTAHLCTTRPHTAAPPPPPPA